MSMLSPEELARLASAESLFPSPIPVQSVSSDEFMPSRASSSGDSMLMAELRWRSASPHSAAA